MSQKSRCQIGCSCARGQFLEAMLFQYGNPLHQRLDRKHSWGTKQMKVIRHHNVAADAPRFGLSPCVTATESARANSGLRSLLQTVRKIITGSLNLSLTGGCAGCLRFSTRFEGAADADALQDSSKIQFYHALVLLVRACCVSRDVGRSIARISTHGESGCPLLVSISQRKAGF